MNNLYMIIFLAYDEIEQVNYKARRVVAAETVELAIKEIAEDPCAHMIKIISIEKIDRQREPKDDD